MRDLRTLPKAHRHLHLELGMRPSTLVDLADKYDMEVPVIQIRQLHGIRRDLPCNDGHLAETVGLGTPARRDLRRRRRRRCGVPRFERQPPWDLIGHDGEILGENDSLELDVRIVGSVEIISARHEPEAPACLEVDRRGSHPQPPLRHVAENELDAHHAWDRCSWHRWQSPACGR